MHYARRSRYNGIMTNGDNYDTTQLKLVRLIRSIYLNSIVFSAMFLRTSLCIIKKEHL